MIGKHFVLCNRFTYLLITTAIGIAVCFFKALFPFLKCKERKSESPNAVNVRNFKEFVNATTCQ